MDSVFNSGSHNISGSGTVLRDVAVGNICCSVTTNESIIWGLDWENSGKIE